MAYIDLLGSSVLSGRGAPQAERDCLMRAENIRAGIDRFARGVAADLSTLPSQVSDDFLVQEALQQILDNIVSGFVARIAEWVDDIDLYNGPKSSAGPFSGDS